MSVRRQGKKRKGKGFLNKLIDNLPVELHLPGYQYCGPGTKLQKRLLRGDKGINPLDSACKTHDIEYSKSSDLKHRHLADLELAKQAFRRVTSSDANFGERSAALAVAGIMRGKVKMGGKLKQVKDIAKLKAAIKKSLINKKNKKTKVIKPPKKRGGILPLVPIFAGLSALGALAGGGAQIVKAVKSAQANKKNLLENIRHNKTMEAIALGKQGSGLWSNNDKNVNGIIKQHKKGKGLYLRPYKSGGEIRLKKKL